ncbi:MAG: hypothetical protein IIA49_06470 [Bacteroidetes bacterium]|nr:hypothetical protein [Bacteroidota bacterium]
MEILKFNKEFVERTINILNSYKGKFEFSNLLNCTLGLIILPYENMGSSSYWKSEIVRLEDIPSFTIKLFEPIKKMKKGRIIRYPKTIGVLLRKIRNGLAHQNIKPINKNNEFVGIKIFNKYKNKLDLDIEFTREELYNFAIYISNKYLKEDASG